MNEIVDLINKYLRLKEKCKDNNNNENKYFVFNKFMEECFELTSIICKIINTDDYTEESIYKNEEDLVNEIADVLFTTARLIKEFKLEESLMEMIEYKYHRQCIREEKIKNEKCK